MAMWYVRACFGDEWTWVSLESTKRQVNDVVYRASRDRGTSLLCAEMLPVQWCMQWSTLLAAGVLSGGTRAEAGHVGACRLSGQEGAMGRRCDVWKCCLIVLLHPDEIPTSPPALVHCTYR